jgi:hypothetical protein
MTESIEKNEEKKLVVYEALDIELSGILSKDRIKNELCPHLVDVLVNAGEIRESATKRIEKSIGELIKSKKDITSVEGQAALHALLHNIDFDIKNGNVYDLQARARDKENPLPKANITTSPEKKQGWWNKDFVGGQNKNQSEQTLTVPASSNIPVENLNDAEKPNWQEEYLQWQESGKTDTPKVLKSSEPVPPADTEKNSQASVEGDEKSPTLIHPAQMTSELDRLIKYTKALREKTGVGHQEAWDEKAEFFETRTKIRQIRNRIKKIKQGTETEEDVVEVKKLWDEMVVSVGVLETATKKNFDSKSEAVHDEPSHIEGEVKVGDTYKAMIDGVLTVVTIKVLTDKNLYAVTYEKNGKELTYTVSKDELQPLTESIVDESSKDKSKTSETGELLENSKRKERLVLRNDWKEKKLQFETENAAYLQSEKERREAQSKMGSIAEKFAFWKKENKPASLLLSEQAYQLARKEYAMQLRLAVTERQGKKSVGLAENNFAGNEENITTAFANRFVIAAVSDRAKQEELFVPTGKRSEVLKELREGLRKHSRAIKYGSIFATTGLAIVSGGFFAGANALLGRTISAKLAAGGAVAGSYLGGYIGSAITQNRENKRNASMKKAQKGFSVSMIEQFESEYFKNYKAFERAAKNERKYAVGGAIIGGLAGSALGGNLDIVEALEKNSYEGLGSVNEYIGQKDFHQSNTARPEIILKPEYNTAGAMNEYLSPADPHESSTGKAEVEGKILDRIVQTEKGDLSPKVDNDQLIKDIERVLEREPSPSEEIIVEQTPDIHYTFIPGDKINTVSEALCSLVEKNPSLIEGDMTPGEAVRDFNHEIEHLKQDNPDYYYDLLDQMGVTSGNIDEVGAGKTYNFTPLFEYLNSLPE